jgi:pimeloyl-ACP methyl ester carboxylesterase
MSIIDHPPIVLVPGFMTDSDLWTDLIPELMQHRLRRHFGRILAGSHRSAHS